MLSLSAAATVASHPTRSGKNGISSGSAYIIVRIQHQPTHLILILICISYVLLSLRYIQKLIIFIDMVSPPSVSLVVVVVLMVQLLSKKKE